MYLLKSFQGNFCQIAHGGTVRTQVSSPLYGGDYYYMSPGPEDQNVEIPCQFAILQFKVTLVPWIITFTVV